MTNTAFDLYCQGEYAKAEEAYRESLSLNPSEPYVHIMIGICLSSQGKHKEAIPFLTSAIELSTDDEACADAYFEIGGIYYKLDDYAKAEEAYRECLALDPSDSFVHILLGISLEQQEKYDESICCYQRGIELSTDDEKRASAHESLGDIYFDREGWEEAIPFLKSGIELITDDAERAHAYGILGTAYMQLKDYANTEAAFQDSLSIDSSEAYFNYMFGGCLVQQERYDEASSYYQKALDLTTDADAERARIYEKLGVAYGKLEDDEKSETAFHESVSLNPSFVGAILNLGMYLAFQGKYDCAIPYFEKVLEFGNERERSFASENLEELYAEKEKWEKKL